MMFDPEQGTETMKRKASVADIGDNDASHFCNNNGVEAEAEAVRRRESTENRTLVCRNTHNVKPNQFMKQFNNMMENNNLCFYEYPLMRCRQPVAYENEMYLIFFSADMCTRALNLSGHVLQGKPIYLERPPEYNGNIHTGNMCNVANIDQARQQQHYKKEKVYREIFVKNVPDGTFPKTLKDFLDRALQKDSLNISQGSPLTNCKIRGQNKAFLVFRTPEETTAALKNLQNILFSGAYLHFEYSRGCGDNMVDSRGYGVGETSRATTTTGQSYYAHAGAPSPTGSSHNNETLKAATAGGSYYGPFDPEPEGSPLPESGETSRSTYQSYYGSCDSKPDESRPRNCSSIGGNKRQATADSGTTDHGYYGPCSSEHEGTRPCSRDSADTAPRGTTSTSAQTYYVPRSYPEREGSPPSLNTVVTDDDAPPDLTHDEHAEIPTKNEYRPSRAKKVRFTKDAPEFHSPNTKVTPPQVREHSIVPSDAELATSDEHPGADLTKLQVALDGANRDRVDLQIQIQKAADEKAELRRQLEAMARSLLESEKSNACLQQEAEQESHKLNVKGQELLVFRKRWHHLQKELDTTRRKLEKVQEAESKEYESSSDDDFDEESPAKVKYHPLVAIKQEPVSDEVWDL